jgi:hypothetical protein
MLGFILIMRSVPQEDLAVFAPRSGISPERRPDWEESLVEAAD